MRPIRLIPDTIAGRPTGYFCTWAAQGDAACQIKRGERRMPEFPGDQGSMGGPDCLDESLLFGPSGWLVSGYEPIRRDLFALLDHGWDIPVGLPISEQLGMGSCEPDPRRFASCRGGPAQRLADLARRIRDAGWGGAGVWICAQVPGDRRGGALMSDAAVEEHWRERARWCRDAGIGYWKVDWGAREGDVSFRRLLTRIAHEEAPGLLVEHAPICGPFNDEDCPWHTFKSSRTGRFGAWDEGRMLATALSLLPHSDVYRTYDISEPLSVSTTLDRVVSLLAGARPGAGLLNTEEELYMGAALGCALGIMRYPAARARCTETLRAVRWQRLMPPVPAGQVTVCLDECLLADSHRFQPGDSWVSWRNNEVIVQKAPARVARNMPLPGVDCAESEPPFVVACRHPNGCTALAALPRRLGETGERLPLAVLTVEADLRRPFGFFGQCRELVIRTSLPPGARLFCQDAAADRAEDITAHARIGAHSVSLPGTILAAAGTRANGAQDLSAPGLVLQAISD